MRCLFLAKTSVLVFILRGGLSEEDTEEEEEEEMAEEKMKQKKGQKEEESLDLQLNLDPDEEFKLPSDEQMEKEDILFICGICEPVRARAWGLGTTKEIHLDLPVSMA